MNRFLFLLLPALTIAPALVGCNGAAAPLPGETVKNRRMGDAESKRAAQSLSIGNVQALDDNIGPYIQALRCSIALDTINERFVESGGFSDEQKHGMREAQYIYERQFARFGTREGKSRDEMRGDRRKQAEQIPELSTRAQIVMGCLRKLT